MKTDQLITLLAHDLEPVDRHAIRRAFAMTVVLGGAVAFGSMVALLGFNPLLRSYLGEPMFWAKLVFGLTLALSSLWAAARLARPGMRLSVAGLLPLAPVAGLCLLAAFALAAAPPGERAELLWGQTWEQCLIGIPSLSLPVLVAILYALRGMAPTQPAWAGAAAGAVAGGLGAAIYALHCPELAAPFLATWYVVGALIPVVMGSVVGRFALRW
jgi:hypothetical protein